ncbi:MAG: hypothetical protein GEV28_25830 [Actinophytocola sp.]|uniref:hypothetical protein n=1 Tax=Actinophytocola sp. TaxID=1872138 RepID=UPI00132A0750|nr:hypothetical protein [Actinophytocola sp.]MPZ83625.1 hypothetical protein [Actinophytocola sp.]
MPSRLPILALAPALLVTGVLLMSAPDAWTVSHLIFLAGTLTMLPAGVLLHDLVRDDGPAWLPWSGRALMFAGALTLAGQFLIDLVVTRLAGGDRTLTGPMFDTIQESTPLALILYQVGPALLFTGLALFGIAFIRRAGQWLLPGWLLVAGTLTVGAARITDLRVVEVIGLGLVLAALVLTVASARAPAERLPAA